MRPASRNAALLLTVVTAPGLLLLRADASSPSEGPPQAVRKSFPGHGLDGVRSDPLTVRFKRPVDLASLPGSFRLFAGTAPAPGDPEGEPLPGTFALAVSKKGNPVAKQVLFTPDLPLSPGTSYTLVLDEGVATDRGAGMAEPFRLTFTTASDKPVDAVTPLPAKTKLLRAPRLGPAPKVGWTFPNLGLGNVFSDEVRIRFSRPMDGKSLNEASVQLLHLGNPVPGTVTFPVNGDPREVRFDPDLPLFPASSYEIRVTRDARTERGRPLTEEFRGAFGTSPFKEGVRPVQPTDFTPGPWMVAGRAFHTGSPLAGGHVLLAGGQDYDGTALASCEVFDRAETAFREVGPLAEARRKHAAAVLKNGKVLVCGGFGASGSTLASAEIFDPVTGFWAPVAPMGQDRANHTATLLENGKVFVFGGFTNASGSLAYASGTEIYDPLTNSWTPGPNPSNRRGGHTATVLSDGRVFIAGGAQFAQRTAEIYDPAKGTLVRTAGLPAEHRLFHAAALTRAGQVLLAGGGPGPAELFDPATGSFFSAGATPVNGLPTVESPYYSTLTPISGSRIALIGGLAPGGAPGGTDLVLAMVQLWDPSAGSGYGAFFPMVFDLAVPRAAHTVTPLGDGRYLIAGGFGTSGSQVGNERRSTIFLPSP